ncbi:MAG: Bax inhibitor-1 family protein [Pseudomonadota bacterium]
MQPDFRMLQAGAPGASQDIVLRQHKVLRNTYMLLALSLIPTVIGATIGTNIDLSFMRASPMLSFVAILAVFYGWIYAIERNKESSLGLVLLLGFTLFLGLLLGPLLHRVLGFKNGTELVMMAAGGTAAVFFVMAGIASSTKRDFSGLTSFLGVGAVVLMLGVVASMFVQSPILYLVILGAFVLFSSLMIMWQVNRIVQGGETNYISATLTLYISIHNLFSALLQLLGLGGRD